MARCEWESVAKPNDVMIGFGPFKLRDDLVLWLDQHDPSWYFRDAIVPYYHTALSSYGAYEEEEFCDIYMSSKELVTAFKLTWC